MHRGAIGAYRHIILYIYAFTQRPKTPIKGFLQIKKKKNKAKSKRDIWERYFNLILKIY